MKKHGTIQTTISPQGILQESLDFLKDRNDNLYIVLEQSRCGIIYDVFSEKYKLLYESNTTNRDSIVLQFFPLCLSKNNQIDLLATLGDVDHLKDTIFTIEQPACYELGDERDLILSIYPSDTYANINNTVLTYDDVPEELL